jgi:hypothetical protein
MSPRRIEDLLTRQSLEKLADKRSFARGLAYFEQGAVEQAGSWRASWDGPGQKEFRAAADEGDGVLSWLAKLLGMAGRADEKRREPSQTGADDRQNGLETGNRTLAQPPAGGAGADSPGPPAAEGGAQHGVRGRAGGPAHPGTGNRAPQPATRYLNAAFGVLSYAELAPHLATRVQALRAAIAAGELDGQPRDARVGINPQQLDAALFTLRPRYFERAGPALH